MLSSKPKIIQFLFRLAIKRKNGNNKDEDNILNIITSNKRQKTDENSEVIKEKPKEEDKIEETGLSGLLPYGSDSDSD